MRQLGKAIGIMAAFEAAEYFAHADVDIMYAPSACHEIVARGEVQRRRLARRHAKAASGLSRREFNLALRKIDPRIFAKAIDRIYESTYPF